VVESVDKNRLIHRKYAALTTTTILVYTLLAVNLFTLRAQKSRRTALPPKNAGSNFHENVSARCTSPGAWKFLQNRLKTREIG
jgi:hypothetical protein